MAFNNAFIDGVRNFYIIGSRGKFFVSIVK